MSSTKLSQVAEHQGVPPGPFPARPEGGAGSHQRFKQQGTCLHFRAVELSVVVKSGLENLSGVEMLRCVHGGGEGCSQVERTSISGTQWETSE